MKPNLCALIPLASMLCAALPLHAETRYVVAPNGDDANPGSVEKPFRTVEAARDAVRALKRDGGLKEPVTVLLRGGMYCLDKPVEFTADDSGTADAPITYAAYPDEKPMLSGGTPITGWKPGANGIWTAELPAVKAGTWYFNQLFTARPGQPYFERRCRTCKGLFVIAGLTDAPYKNATAPVNHRNPQDEVMFFKGDIQPWEHIEDVELVFMHDWSVGRLWIKNIDFDNGIVKFTGYPHYRIGHWYPNGRNPYFVENVKEFLGKPGEWYLERQTGTLFYTPLPDEDMTNLLVVAPRIERLLTVQGAREGEHYVENLTFKGIWFHHTTWLMAPHQYAEKNGRADRQGFPDMPAAAEFAWARNCRVERCHFNHLGAYGLDLGEGCHNNAVVGNRFIDDATGGMKIGTVDRAAQPPVLPTGNEIGNNLISDVGVVHYSGHGIGGWMLANTRIHHNDVRRTSYSPIAVGWDHSANITGCNSNVMEYNHIYDAMLVLDHGGALYTLGNQPGTVMRGNLIHDIHHTRMHGKSVTRPDWAGGPLGLDDGSKNFIIEDNVMYRTAGNPEFTVTRDKGNHTWKNNSFNVLPTDPNFPKAIADKAGLEPAYRDLLDQPIRVTPSPIFAMEVPENLPPPKIVDDFERLQPGDKPRKPMVRLEDQAPGKGTDKVEVTAETAASGKQCLKIVDAPNLSRDWLPHLYYTPSYRDGIVTVTFALRVEKGAIAEHAWRGTSKKTPFSTGPSFRVADGKLTVGDKELMSIPLGEWVRFELRTKLGLYDPGIGNAGMRTDVWQMTVTPANGDKQTFADLKHGTDDFADLNWAGFVSLAKDATVFYLDDVVIQNE
ncbi:MAG: hypothetical protein A3K19_15360 [Lentisphaerae bacterium RIFOXYB12_FULL_65_16]|nr:MAG: hypothetical protein A3K18_29165 [Lentisphaerae bacterium RIFOXYA12_64_32]OGV88477.1 MAG: hypothetical protein A3K19_15360 [Lentisphaerae bacterium RIFOXYB12_FULL_65_16]